MKSKTSELQYLKLKESSKSSIQNLLNIELPIQSIIFNSNPETDILIHNLILDTKSKQKSSWSD